MVCMLSENSTANLEIEAIHRLDNYILGHVVCFCVGLYPITGLSLIE